MNAPISKNLVYLPPQWQRVIKALTYEIECLKLELETTKAELEAAKNDF